MLPGLGLFCGRPLALGLCCARTAARPPGTNSSAAARYVSAHARKDRDAPVYGIYTGGRRHTDSGALRSAGAWPPLSCAAPCEWMLAATERVSQQVILLHRKTGKAHLLGSPRVSLSSRVRTLLLASG